MEAPFRTITRNVGSGALYGACVWTVYAIVECWFSSILPWMIKPGHLYAPLHWGFTVMLFAAYPVIGVILGGLAGLCLSAILSRTGSLDHEYSAIRLQDALVLTVTLAFIVNFVVNYTPSALGLPELPPLFIASLLVILLLMGIGSGIRARRLHFITNPWTVTIALLGLAWLTRDHLINQPRIVKTWAAVAWPGIVFLLSFFVQRIIEKRRAGKFGDVMPASPAKTVALLATVAMLFLGSSFFFVQTPHLRARNTNTLATGHGQHNVILITMDTVRADHMSLYGYKRDTTPNLKKIAEGATLYSRATSSSDLTLPTHASIFTGLYARSHGAYNDPWNGYPAGRPLADNIRTLAEILSEKGFLTMGVVANTAYLTNTFRLDKGFQHYDQREPIVFLGRTRPYYLRQGIRNILTRFASPRDFDKSYLSAGEINGSVYTILSKVKTPDAPFFLFINYMDAHEPYIPPPPFDDLYPGRDETFTLSQHQRLVKSVMVLDRKLTKAERDHLISQYDGGIAYIDFHLGKLIGRLKELGLYENSLIIITSDHGEVFGERDFVGHGVSVYQDQVGVPLIIKYPYANSGGTVDVLASSVDLLPTILDVLGYEIGEDLQGRSLLGLDPGRSRVVVSESFPEGDFLNWHSKFDRIERAVFSGPYKFISSTAGKRELFDLSKDPEEKQNILKAEGGASEELEAELEQWLSTVEAQYGSTQKVQRETLDRLKALGYVQ